MNETQIQSVLQKAGPETWYKNTNSAGKLSIGPRCLVLYAAQTSGTGDEGLESDFFQIPRHRNELGCGMSSENTDRILHTLPEGAGDCEEDRPCS